jgi:hypothetical protein
MNIPMFIYITLAALTTFVAQLEHLNSDEIPSWTWVGWSRFSVYIIISTLTAWKAYRSRPPGEPEPPIVTVTKTTEPKEPKP